MVDSVQGSSGHGRAQQQEGLQRAIKSKPFHGRRLHLKIGSEEKSVAIHGVTGPILSKLGKAKKVRLASGETLYLNKNSLKNLSNSESKRIQSFAKAALRSGEERVTHPQIKTLFHNFPLNFVRSNFSKFNAAADKLKKEPHWRTELRNEIDKMSDEEVLELIGLTSSFKARGYDREVLKEVFKIVGERFDIKTDEGEKAEKSEESEGDFQNMEMSVEHEEEEEVNVQVRSKLSDDKKAKLKGKLDTLQKELSFKGFEGLTVLTKEQVKEMKGKGEELPKNRMVQLNSGALNSVYLITRKNEKGETEEYVFKPDPAEALNMKAELQEQHFGTSVAAGIPSGKEAHLASRAVASSVVDKMLYSEDHRASVNTQFAIVNEQRGIVMSVAKGSSLTTSSETKTETVKDEKLNKDFLKRYQDKGNKLSAKDKKELAAKLHFRKITDVKVIRDNKTGDRKLQVTGTKARLTQKIGKEEQEVNLTKPKTLEGLIKLQVKDIITGECDRHPQNYYIDSNGEVTGIDEDCSFGVNARKAEDVRKQGRRKVIIPNNGSLMLRMPPVVTKNIKEQVRELYLKKDDLRKELAPYITKEEIDATIDRLEQLNDHIDYLEKEGRVVDTVEDLNKPEYLKLMDSNNSIYGRETLAYNSDESGWNYLRKHRKY